MDAETKTKRSNPPRCARCNHSKSFHSKAAGGQCKALGCATCQEFVSAEGA